MAEDPGGRGMTALYTIGYETATLPEVIARLSAAGCAVVADVRAVASSRKAGFSKTALAAGLGEAGIAYAQFRALGTPKAGRDAARKGRIAEMRAIFEGQLATPEAIDALAALERLVAERPTALLCYEDDAAGCHRRAIAERLAERLPLRVTDL